MFRMLSFVQCGKCFYNRIRKTEVALSYNLLTLHSVKKIEKQYRTNEKIESICGAAGCVYAGYGIVFQRRRPVVRSSDRRSGKRRRRYETENRRERYILRQNGLRKIRPLSHGFWSGDKVAEGKTYTFTPDKTGSFEVVFIAVNSIGRDEVKFSVNVVKYKGGFFIVNEGSFGRTMGTVDYFADASSRTPAVYKAANPGKELGNTTDYGALWNGNYYFVSKQGRKLVKASEADFKDQGEFTPGVQGADADGRSFAGVDANHGVYTTANGAYIVDLNTFTGIKYLEGSKGSGTTGMSAQCGAAVTEGDYIFVINIKDGVLVYSKADYSFIKNLCPAHIGFVKSKDGSLWASDGGSLYRINTSSLSVVKTDLPEGLSVYTDRWAWKPAIFAASSSENALFFGCADGYEVKKIYKYEIGNASSLSQPFAQGGATDFLYGAGIQVDPSTGDVLASFTGVSWGDNKNKLVVFDGKTGAEKSRFEYEEYVFPAMIIFND